MYRLEFLFFPQFFTDIYFERYMYNIIWEQFRTCTEDNKRNGTLPWKDILYMQTVKNINQKLIIAQNRSQLSGLVSSYGISLHILDLCSTTGQLLESPWSIQPTATIYP